MQETKTPEPEDIAIGKRLKARRLASGLTLAEMGRRLNVSPQLIDKYENAVCLVSFSALAKFAAALGCTASDLVNGLTTGDTPDPYANDFDLMARPHSAEILRLFHSIKSSKRRRILMNVISSMAKDTTGSDK